MAYPLIYGSLVTAYEEPFRVQPLPPPAPQIF